MKITTQLLWLLLLFLCATTIAKCQDNLKAADSLFELEKYQEAALFYEYCAWELSDRNLINQCRFKKAIALYHCESFEPALRELNKINLASTSTKLRQEVIILELKTRFSTGNYGLLEGKGRFYEPFIVSFDQPKKVEFYRLLALGSYYNGNIMGGYHFGEKYLSIFHKEQADSIVQAFSNAHRKIKIRRINPDRIKLLGGICPGCISLFQGDPKTGTLSILAEIIALGLSTVSFYNGLYVTAVLISGGTLWIAREEAFKEFAEKIDKKNRLNTQRGIQPVLKYFID